MIRSFTHEDKDYIINSHYELYNKEYNYDLSFRNFIEGKVEDIIKKTYDNENTWILEIERAKRGSISIRNVSDKVAQLGLFLVEPATRGTGYGTQLVENAIAFCKEKGYQTVILWTNSDHTSARNIYKKQGFQLKQTKIKTLSNKELSEEKWELSV